MEYTMGQVNIMVIQKWRGQWKKDDVPRGE